MRKSSVAVVECIKVDGVGEDNEAEMPVTQGRHAFGIGWEAVWKTWNDIIIFYDRDNARRERLRWSGMDILMVSLVKKTFNRQPTFPDHRMKKVLLHN